MKSAFELAMERLGGTLHEYTEEQKEQLAEIDRVFDARIAQARFAARARQEEARNDPAQTRQVQDDLAVELRSLEEQREKKKEALRAEFQRSAGER